MDKENLKQSDIEEFLWEIILDIKTLEELEVAKTYVGSFMALGYEMEPFRNYVRILENFPLEKGIKEYCRN